jgi:hypothetical protein
MVIGALASDIDIDAATGIDMRAGANMAVSAVSNMTLDASSLYINTGAGNLTLDANESAKQIFRIGGVDVIEVFKTSYYNANAESNVTQYTVKINADFEIVGGVNSVGINQTTLNIEDKSIHLSHNPVADRVPLRWAPHQPQVRHPRGRRPRVGGQSRSGGRHRHPLVPLRKVVHLEHPQRRRRPPARRRHSR